MANRDESVPRPHIHIRADEDNFERNAKSAAAGDMIGGRSISRASRLHVFVSCATTSHRGHGDSTKTQTPHVGGSSWTLQTRRSPGETDIDVSGAKTSRAILRSFELHFDVDIRDRNGAETAALLPQTLRPGCVLTVANASTTEEGVFRGTRARCRGDYRFRLFTPTSG